MKRLIVLTFSALAYCTLLATSLHLMAVVSGSPMVMRGIGHGVPEVCCSGFPVRRL